jgi:signal transduction histidine kinase
MFETTEEETRERTRWLIRGGAWTAAAALLIVLVVSALLPNVLDPKPLLVATAVYAVCSAATYHLHGRIAARPGRVLTDARLAHSHLVLDMVFLTVFLHFAGGLETPFFVFYLIYVALASVLFPQGLNLVYAGLASLLYALLLVLEWRLVIPHYHLEGFRDPTRFQQPIHVLVTVLTLAVSAFAVAYLVSRIVLELRSKQQELIQANLFCETRGQELTGLNSRLQDMDKARSQFIRLVTHELRAPVAAIQSYLKLILDGYVPAEKHMEIIQRSERRALDQLALISDLLYMSRLEEPAPEAKTEPVDIAEVLRRVSELIRGQAEHKGIAFSTEITPGLPPIDADPEHMNQLWTNLISNGIKYTAPGGAVRVTLSQTADGIVGSVQDTGIGISKEEQSRLFQQFWRSDAAKQMERHGTGLGLSIVKRIVETYGGRIWVDSEPGVGSTFTFMFPVRQRGAV